MQFPSGECALEAATFLKLGRHPCLVPYIGTCSNPSLGQIILTEFAHYGSLSDLLVEKGRDITFTHKLTMMRQISSAMEALSQVNVVHGNMAARNVLVFHFDAANPQRTRIKVSEYGLSAVGKSGGSHRTSNVVGVMVRLPIRWMSPEAIKEGRFNEASDMWAMGVTMWEILTGGETPYAHIQDNDHVAQQVCDGTLRLSRPPEGCPEGLWALIQGKCWNPDPKRRPTFKELSVALDMEGLSLSHEGVAVAERGDASGSNPVAAIKVQQVRDAVHR